MWRMGLIIYFFMLFATGLQADVFWRLGPARGATRMEAMGGTRVYTTRARVNGREGDLHVYSVNDTASCVAQQLARSAGQTPPRAMPAACFQLSDTRDGRVHHTMILPSPRNDATCIAVTFDAPMGRTSAPEWPAGMPVFAATPSFSAVCYATRAAFLTALSSATPARATEEVAAAFRDAGWSIAAPPTGACVLLTRGNATAVISTSANENVAGGGSVINVLQREGLAF